VAGTAADICRMHVASSHVGAFRICILRTVSRKEYTSYRTELLLYSAF
jgi:hypothetical protein